MDSISVSATKEIATLSRLPKRVALARSLQKDKSAAVDRSEGIRIVRQILREGRDEWTRTPADIHYLGCHVLDLLDLWGRFDYFVAHPEEMTGPQCLCYAVMRNGPDSQKVCNALGAVAEYRVD